MEPQSEEVREHQNSFDALFHKLSCGAGKIGLPEFQEGGFDVRKVAGARQFRSHQAYRLVGRFNARTMSENDDSGGHALPET